MRKTPKVALLVETARAFGRDLLRGIARYAQHHGPWSFYINPGDFEHALPEMKLWGGTGIIARIPNEQIARAVLAAKLPTIALGLTDEQKKPGNPLARLPELSSNADEVAQLVANHLLERRFSHRGRRTALGRQSAIFWPIGCAINRDRWACLPATTTEVVRCSKPAAWPTCACQARWR